MRLNIALLFILFMKVGIVSAQEPIQPIPQNLPTDPQKVALGKKLYFDKQLSKDHTVACVSCHELKAAFGTDLSPVSTGINGQKGGRNAPTVYNSALNFAQFWDGRAATLADQAAGPPVNPVEMGMHSWADIVKRLQDDPNYESDFLVYGGTISEATVTDAIAEYEKTLLLANSPFDRYLAGDTDALNEQEKLGYQRFQQYGCVACHQGRNVGGNMYQKFGILKDIGQSGLSLADDLGRYEVTENEADKHVFKVPSLRLVTKTAPYFHDGSVETLEEAINIMIEYQLGREVPQQDIDAIIAFLGTLVGELPEEVK